MWYTIKKNKYTFTVKKFVETSEPIEAWFTRYFGCGLEEDDEKLQYKINGLEVDLTLPQCTSCKENDETYGLYKLHIKVGENFYDEIVFPYFPAILNSLVEDLENLFCGCPCPDCKDCVDEKELLNIAFKIMFYYSLSGNYYQPVFGKAIKCLDCNLTEEAVCLLLNEKIYGRKFNKIFFKRLLAIFYLTFYYTENTLNCDKDYLNTIFNIKKIKPCLENLGIDLNCILKQMENQKPKTGDSWIYIDNREEVIITPRYFYETIPAFFDLENNKFDYIKITSIELDEGLNNGITTKAQLVLNGIPVVEGQNINFNDIIQGKLKYVARDSNRSGVSSFTWEVVENMC